MAMTLEVLVDYNNVREADRRKGVVFVVDTVVQALGTKHVGEIQRILFRVYDGWYENTTPTRKAQEVGAELLAKMPMTFTLGSGVEQVKVLVNAELAYSLKSAPAQHIWHTYRPTYYPGDIRCRDPHSAGCTDSQCPLAAMQYLLKHRCCPKAGCNITPEAFLYRSQQKLVDTMIATDLFALHLQSSRKVAVVTSDDDLWPAIKLVLQLGVQVLHIHTIPNRPTPAIYCGNAGTGYFQLHL